MRKPASSAQPQSGPTLTLSDALQRAVDKNSAIAAARLARQVKVAGVESVKAAIAACSRFSI